MVQSHNVRAVSPQLAPGPDRLINGVLTEGVWNLAADHYKVTQQAVAAMSVRVGSGTAYDKAVVDGDAGGQGTYISENQDARSGDGNADVPIANGGAQGRIDLVVLQISDDEFDSSGTWGAEVVVIQGDEAASPSAPAVPDSALPLAEVAVAAGLDSGITDAMITDRRVQAHLSEDLRRLRARRDWRSGNQSLTSGTVTTVLLNTESFNVGQGGALSGGQWTIPRTGWYRATAQIRFETNATGIRQLRIRRAGTELARTQQSAAATGQTLVQITSGLFLATVGDIVDVQALQNCGAALNVEGGEYDTWGLLEFVAP